MAHRIPRASGGQASTEGPAADGRSSAERLQALAETLEEVTSRLEGVGADSGAAAPELALA